MCDIAFLYENVISDTSFFIPHLTKLGRVYICPAILLSSSAFVCPRFVSGADLGNLWMDLIIKFNMPDIWQTVPDS